MIYSYGMRSIETYIFHSFITLSDNNRASSVIYCTYVPMRIAGKVENDIPLKTAGLSLYCIHTFSNRIMPCDGQSGPGIIAVVVTEGVTEGVFVAVFVGLHVAVTASFTVAVSVCVVVSVTVSELVSVAVSVADKCLEISTSDEESLPEGKDG